jgi:hypothetical protein
MKQIPDIAAEEIARLRREGIAVTDDEVVWLACLGWKVENPRGVSSEESGARESLALSDGTVIRPLTLRASSWLDRYGSMFSGSRELIAVAYCMCNRAVDLDATTAETVAAVNAWAGSLDVTPGELEKAVARMLPSDEVPRKPEKPQSITDLIGFLVAATGLPHEYWLDQTWVTVDATQTGIIRHAAMIAQNGGDPDDIGNKEAFAAFIRAVEEVRRRHG